MATVTLLNLFCWYNRLAPLIRGRLVNLSIKILDSLQLKLDLYFSL